MKREGDLRMTDGLKMKLMLDVAALGIFRAQEISGAPAGCKRANALPPACRALRRHRGPTSSLPPLTKISVPAIASGSRVVSRNRETLAMLGNASPRNPSVATAWRSSAERILLVACRSSERRASSRSMPQPSSITRMSEIPPRRIEDVDLARAGIDAVLDQLLHDRGRPLDHFARRHLAGDSFGQQIECGSCLDWRFEVRLRRACASCMFGFRAAIDSAAFGSTVDFKRPKS